jgi:hypothetical protein
MVLNHTSTKRRFEGWSHWHIIDQRITMSTQTGTQPGYDPGNFYVWRASDGFAIHLSLNVVRQLTAQISREGSEAAGMRGILLGRIVETPLRATVIEDFKLIPESDDAQLEIASRTAQAGKEQRALGFFRAQRDGTLNIRQRDLKTFSRLFCETGNVGLLIQTSRRGNQSDAALFYWQNSGVQPRDFGFGFPLDAGQLASGDPGWRFPDPLEDTPAVAMPPAPPPAPNPSTSQPSKEGIRWLRLLPTAALVAIGIGALEMATSSSRTVDAAPAPTEAAASESTSSAAVPGLGLTVTTHPHQLEIRWNRQSAEIEASDQGLMKITDDGITESVPFDPSQLRDGYVAYTPKTTDVSIRLEVTGKDGTTSESIRSVAIP